MSDQAPTAAPTKPKKPIIAIKDGGLDVTFDTGEVWSFLPVDPDLQRQFAQAGLRYLAAETLRKNPADPVAELAARFARVTATAWGDEKSGRPAKPPKPDPVEELVEIIHAAKVAAGLAPDDERTRKVLVGEPPRSPADLVAFLRKVRKEPTVAAEIARRKSGGAPTAAGLDVL